MDAGAIAIETLRLRQWRDADYAPFAALNADAEVMRYFPADAQPMWRPRRARKNR
ncbi:hypothetical protein D9M68_674950 [compost metagenome]